MNWKIEIFRNLQNTAKRTKGKYEVENKTYEGDSEKVCHTQSTGKKL